MQRENSGEGVNSDVGGTSNQSVLSLERVELRRMDLTYKGNLMRRWGGTGIGLGRLKAVGGT